MTTELKTKRSTQLHCHTSEHRFSLVQKMGFFFFLKYDRKKYKDSSAESILNSFSLVGGVRCSISLHPFHILHLTIVFLQTSFFPSQIKLKQPAICCISACCELSKKTAPENESTLLL